MGSLLSCFVENDYWEKKKPNKFNFDQSPLKIYKLQPNILAFDKLSFKSQRSSEDYLLNSEDETSEELGFDKLGFDKLGFDKLSFKSPSSSEDNLLNFEDETSDIDICYTSKLD